MITFRVKNGNVYVTKDGIEEFNEYLMTVDDIINIIELNNSPIDGHKITKEKLTMLRSFFNNPNRVALKMSLSVFSDFSYGYGVVNGKMEKIIMWKDDKDRINFGMYVDNGVSPFEGTFEKIHVTDGDVFIKSQMTAALYLAKVKKEQEEQAKKKAEYIEKLKSKVEFNEAVLNGLHDANDKINSDMKELATKYVKLVAEKAKLKFKIHNCEHAIESLKRKIKKE